MPTEIFQTTTAPPFNYQRRGSRFDTVESASSVFTPLDIAGCILWLDASDTATITESSNAVSQWSDKSGTSNHVTQSTGANKPTTNIRTINSLNAIDFGGNDFLRTTNTVAAQAFTVLLVTSLDAAAVDFARPFDGYDGADANRALFYYRLAGNWQVQAGAAANTTRAVSTGLHQHTIIYNNTSSQFYEDGTQYGGSLSPGTGGLPDLSIGADNTGGTGWDGLIAEFLIYNVVLNASNRETLENYLSTRWATP